MKFNGQTFRYVVYCKYFVFLFKSGRYECKFVTCFLTLFNKSFAFAHSEKTRMRDCVEKPLGLDTQKNV